MFYYKQRSFRRGDGQITERGHWALGFLDMLGCSSTYHLKPIGPAHDVGLCGFALLLVTTGWHICEGNSPHMGLHVHVFQRWQILLSEVAVGDLPPTAVKTRPDPYFFCMKTRHLGMKFGSTETLVTILKCVVLILTFAKWSKLFNSTMLHQFKNLNHTFFIKMEWPISISELSGYFSCYRNS